MTTLHPALPETYVVTVNPQASEGFTRTPVLAWTVEDKRPLPVTLNGKHTLIGGDSAVEFPGGMVHHPDEVLAYDNIETWLESNPGVAKKAQPAEVKKPPATEAEGAYDIEWTDGTFKNNSFWHYYDAEYEFVFQIDGGSPLPKATSKCVKIKRDEFMAKKKEVDALSVEDIMSADPLPVEEEEEHDDADDLI